MLIYNADVLNLKQFIFNTYFKFIWYVDYYTKAFLNVGKIVQSTKQKIGKACKNLQFT